MDTRLTRTVHSPLTEDQLAPPAEGCGLVQFGSPLSERDLRRLAAFLREYPSLDLRIFGHTGIPEIDLEVLQHFPFVRKVRVDIWNVANLAGLRHLNPDLESLSISATRKRFSLDCVLRFSHLKRLYIDGHTKDFEAVGELSELRDLTLRGVTLADLSPLVRLKALEELCLELGGSHDLSALKHLTRLRKLEIAMVRGLSDIDVVADIEPLEKLTVSFLPRLVKFPSLARLQRLTVVDIEKLPGLQDLTPIAEAPALEKFWFVNMPKLPIDSFQSLVGHPTLREVRGGLGSTKKNRLLKARFPFVDTWTESNKVTLALINAALKRSHDKRP